MSLIDIGIIIFALAMAAVGYERGLIGSALPLAGFVGGVALGARLGPALLADGSSSEYAPLVAAAGGVLLGLFGAIVLEGVGEGVRLRLQADPLRRQVDGAGGAVLLAMLALFVAWVFGAVVLNAADAGDRKLREAIQDSSVLAALNNTLPPSGPLLNSLRRIDPAPRVRGPVAAVRGPDRGVLRDRQVRRAARSVVRVLSTACGLGVQGSGWIAGPGTVVTNAHVVAGAEDTSVLTLGGADLDATAVHYEPRNDLAILRVDGLDAAALTLAGRPRPGTAAAAVGYPENGPLTLTPARLGRAGVVESQDSYGRGPLRRRMTPFRGEVRRGNSGGPVIDGRGRVLGTVFATELAASGPPSGLAVPNEIVRRALAGRLAATDTGPCTGG